MDAFRERGVSGIVVMSSAQVGKTEILNNSVGYFVHADPSPILVVLPTVNTGEAWSKDRLAPMVRDTPVLRNLISPAKSRDSENTIMHKTFPGGNITIVGANSPSDLAGRPKRGLLADEVDRFPKSAGSEGDPFLLAKKRTTSFWNRFWAAFSTPTVKGSSRIEDLFEKSDKRFYNVPCPFCGHMQVLRWANMKWEHRDPSTARYECRECGQLIDDSHKMSMLRCGEWIATEEFNGTAGFHLCELYSPFTSWEDMVSAWLQAQHDVELLRVFVNTSLGETFEEEGENVDEQGLKDRCEIWSSVPEQVRFITAGVDVQDDRLEVEVVGWGRGYENWSLDYFVFWGDPDQDSLWKNIDGLLSRSWDGRQIDAMAIDSGGHKTDAVYKFCKKRWARRVYAIKGMSSGWGKPLVSLSVTKNKKTKVRLFMVSVDEAKKQFYVWLRQSEPGPGYCHFPAGRVDEYFAQLTAETLRQKFTRGFRSFYWEKDRARNEALDCRVYARAALQICAPELDEYINALDGVQSQGQPVAPAESDQSTDDCWLNGGGGGWEGGGSWLDG